MDQTIDCIQSIKKISQYQPGKARSEYVQSLAALYNISVSTVYRWYRDICPNQERKVRSDKGDSLVSDDQAKLLGSMIYATKRRSKKILLPTKAAKEIADDNNLKIPDVSVSTLNRRLRDIRFSKADMKQESPSIRLITQHPNQLWQFDVSNCIQYRLEDKKGLQERDIEMEFYKNKLENFKSIKQELLRYLMVDHCAGTFYLEYFYTTGETLINAAEFFLHACQEKKDARYRFHGVPFNLYVDRGSAVKSDIIQGLLERLQIKLITHMPGNPRAKGMVEGLHDYVERNFESRLVFHKPGCLEDLNSWAFDWLVKVNATEIFRKTAPRSQMWSTITRDQLRLCPKEEVYRRLLVSNPESREVGSDLKFQYDGRIYIVPDPNLKGEKIMVSYSPYEYPNVLVSHESLEHQLCLSPCQNIDNYGRITDGAVIFGRDENDKLTYKRHKDTETQKHIKEAEKILETFGLSMKGTGDKRRAMAPPVGEEKLTVFGHQAAKVANIVFMDKTGTHLPIDKSVEIRDLPYMKAIKIIMDRLGRSLKVSESDWIQAEFGQTVPEAAIDGIVQKLNGTGASIRNFGV